MRVGSLRRLLNWSPGHILQHDILRTLSRSFSIRFVVQMTSRRSDRPYGHYNDDRCILESAKERLVRAGEPKEACFES